MKACVTGATGFLGAHVVAMLVRRGDDVRVTVRDRRRLRALEGLDVEVVDADVLDRRAIRRAMAGCDVLFHTAGVVASRPYNRVWRVNAVAPRIAVEEAARAEVGRVVVTSSVASIGPALDGRAATERNPYPPGGTGLLYTDSKHEGEAAALGAAERVGLDVVSVCPSYVLGPAHNRGLPGETSTRIVANYLRGRLPAVVDAYTNIVDVEDVAQGHLLAAEAGRPGQRYILGGENLRLSKLLEMLEILSGRPMPRRQVPYCLAYTFAAMSQFFADHVTGQPPRAPLAGVQLVRHPMRFDNRRALAELGLKPRPVCEALADAIAWFHEQGLLELPDVAPVFRLRSQQADTAASD
jgi:dihydroflavonol-4-reductase